MVFEMEFPCEIEIKFYTNESNIPAYLPGQVYYSFTKGFL
jgi:hypothetical protein